MTDRAWNVVRVALLGAALALLGESVRRVILRMQFDYDLLLWADDYFMTSMFKLAAGLSVYTDIDAANSTIYAPGGPFIHYVALAPFGLETNLLANRVLNQCFLATDVLLAALLVFVLVEESGLRLDGGVRRLGIYGGSAALLALAAYANPVADSLHPSNLEIATLLAAALALARWPHLANRSRTASALLLPAVALLAKQTAGLAVAGALVWRLLVEGGRGKTRLRLLLPLVSLAAVLVALQLKSGGMFKTWAFDVLAAQHFDWWKVRDIYAGYFLLYAPAVATAGGFAVIVWRRKRISSSGAWFRAASVVVLYAPFALTALFKAMGGPNNLAVVGFLALVLALPIWISLAFDERRRPRLRLAVHAAYAVQVALLHPRRRVPESVDFENAKTICDYAAARMRCGERVMLGRGSVCYARGGIVVPTDRMNSIIEVTVAGRRDEVGFFRRTALKQYDLIILPARDLMWGGQYLWNIMRFRYRPFFMTSGELEGDFWYHGWQGFATLPVVFWERLDAKGTHEVSATGLQCAERLDPGRGSR